MKKTFFICALSALVSSSGVSATELDNNSEPAVNVVSNTTNSSMSNDTISLEKYPFKSPDRQLYDLRGNVSKMVIKRLRSNSAWSDTVDKSIYGETEYLFDKDGKLIDKPNDSGNEWKSTRSGNGRILKREMRFEDGEGYSKKYLYNKDGMLEKQMEEDLISIDTIKYQYDGYLNLISSTSSGVFEEFQRLRDITNYKIVERDSKGNWTKRYLTRLHENIYNPSILDENYEGDEKEVVEKSTDYTIELREIEYYADSQSVSSVSSDSQRVEPSTSKKDSLPESVLSFLVYASLFLVYFGFLSIVFLIIKLVITKIFLKEVSKKKMRKYFLIALLFPFVLFKCCDSCSDDSKKETKSEKTQESYVRKFLADNEASSLVLPKFKVNSYEDSTNAYDKWVIEFEEPIDKSKLITLETSEKSYLDRDVLCFPIEEKDEYNPIYDHRIFKLELLPDGKTAILLYSYHKIHPDISVSGGGSSHHWHHDD